MRSFVASTLLGLAVFGLCAEAGAQASALLTNSKDCTQNGMACRFWEPDGYNAANKYPLVIYLHGAGQAGNDNHNQFESFAAMLWPLLNGGTGKPNYPTFVMTPQAPSAEGNQRWVNWDWEKGSYSIALPETPTLVEVRSMIGALQAKYNIDPERLYVIGYSMGGVGAWDMIARNPALFAGGSPTAGDAPPDAAPTMKNMAVWSYHNADDGNVPASSDREMFKALALAGSRPTYTEGVTGGHFNDGGNASNPAFYPWLFEQRRNAPATSVPDMHFAPEGGEVSSPVQVTLSSAIDGAKIYYTLDGTVPSPSNGTLYAGPFMLTQSAIVMAVASTSEVNVYHAAPFEVGNSPLPPGAELMPGVTVPPPPPATGGATGSGGASNSGGANSSGGVSAGASGPTGGAPSSAPGGESKSGCSAAGGSSSSQFAFAGALGLLGLVASGYSRRRSRVGGTGRSAVGN